MSASRRIERRFWGGGRGPASLRGKARGFDAKEGREGEDDGVKNGAQKMSECESMLRSGELEIFAGREGGSVERKARRT